MIILERSMILMGRYEQYANNRVGLLQEIVIAFAIQVLPIILYRFFVKKTDIKKSTSSVVSVVSFFVTVVGLIILGRRRYIPYTLLLAFSFLDYWFLTMKTTGLGQSKTSDNIMNDTMKTEYEPKKVLLTVDVTALVTKEDSPGRSALLGLSLPLQHL